MKHSLLEIGLVAGNKKIAELIDTTIVFIDESGLLPTPMFKATWAPKGHTPKVTNTLSKSTKISSIAALIVIPHRQHFRSIVGLQEGTNINAERAEEFLRQEVLRAIPSGPVVIVWDKSKSHQSVFDGDFPLLYHRYHDEYFPAYDPELNPVEYLWAYCKNALANTIPGSSMMLVRRINHKQSILHSFVTASGHPWKYFCTNYF